MYWPRRFFLEGMTSLRIGDRAAAARYADELARTSGVEAHVALHAQMFSRLIRVELLRTQRKQQEALTLLGQPHIGPEFLWPEIISYPFAHERWLRAELLHELGRDQEALRWYGTFPDRGAYDLIYLAPSHLRRAQIYEKAGNKTLARKHYERTLALWANAESPANGSQ
jgi:tetratricopeptide (TPR) repeat protein